jgi:hypothetical protein
VSFIQITITNGHRNDAYQDSLSSIFIYLLHLIISRLFRKPECYLKCEYLLWSLILIQHSYEKRTCWSFHHSLFTISVIVSVLKTSVNDPPPSSQLKDFFFQSILFCLNCRLLNSEVKTTYKGNKRDLQWRLVQHILYYSFASSFRPALTLQSLQWAWYTLSLCLSVSLSLS